MGLGCFTFFWVPDCTTRLLQKGYSIRITGCSGEKKVSFVSDPHLWVLSYAACCLTAYNKRDNELQYWILRTILHVGEDLNVILLKRDSNSSGRIHTSFRVGMTSLTIGVGVRNLVLLCSVFTNLSSGKVRPLIWQKCGYSKLQSIWSDSDSLRVNFSVRYRVLNFDVLNVITQEQILQKN